MVLLVGALGSTETKSKVVGLGIGVVEGLLFRDVDFVVAGF